MEAKHKLDDMRRLQSHTFWLRLLAFTALTVAAVGAHTWGLFDQIGLTGGPHLCRCAFNLGVQ